MAGSSSPPNIVLIMTDQQRWDTIRAWGHSWMHTPNMDRLARNGVSFRSAYVPAATCVASRAAMFTGMFAHNTGAYSFNNWSHHRNWVQDLSDAGYWCVNIGKMHFQPHFDAPGFDERIVVENPTSPPFICNPSEPDDAWGHYLNSHGAKRPLFRNRTDPDWTSKIQAVPWHLDEHLHSDVFIGNSAVGWIKNQRYQEKRKHPLFLQIGFTGPHEPYDPLPRHLERYEDAEIPDPIFTDNEFDKKPPQHRAHQENFANRPGEGVIPLKDASLEAMRTMRKHYCAKVSTVDEKIGEILDELEAEGILENSIIAFCSDHGDMLGDHRLPYKWLMYEPVTHVPFIVWDARNDPQGTDVNSMVSLMDLGPTLLDAAGIKIPRYLEGQSLLPWTRGESGPSHPFVCAEDNYQTMMREERYKIVLYTGAEYGELYDLDSDPYELDNRWDDPALHGEKCRLLDQHRRWLAESCYKASPFKSRSYQSPPPREPTAPFYLHG
tara:strand:- start:53018 stop:54496 length:1479 start_codon:yes stop_codon:yes gene_type:complete